jgi:periplasmic divalent cation tolerance protein
MTCLIYTTFPDIEHATATARDLVNAHLAACCNILPGMQSVYWWEGAVQEQGEVVMLVKTTNRMAGPAMARIARLHPYENPAILQLPVQTGAADYLAWIARTVLPADAAQ